MKTLHRVEELAKEFFNCRDARLDIGKTGAALWISDPQRGHYIDAKDAARFYNWAVDIIRWRHLPSSIADLLEKVPR